MTRAKKDIGRKGQTSDPVSTGKKKPNTGQTISGHPESDGGSRQGNAEHDTPQKQAEVSDSLNVRMSRI